MKSFIILGIICVVIVIGALLYSQIQKPPQIANQTATTDIQPTQERSISPTMDSNTDKLVVEDITVGTGKEAKAGDTVVMNYKGTFSNGTQFDSSYDRGQPFTTKIGVGQVIKGWDQGVPGMKVGGKRKLTIPPDLAYGANGIPGAIPPNSTLIFEVELLDVK